MWMFFFPLSESTADWFESKTTWISARALEAKYFYMARVDWFHVDVNTIIISSQISSLSELPKSYYARMSIAHN